MKSSAMSIVLCLFINTCIYADDKQIEAQFGNSFAKLIASHCLECHSTDVAEADIDLENLLEWDNLSSNALVLQRALEQIKNDQMPPAESQQFSADEKKNLIDWSTAWLRTEAQRRAGDPGPVILRRLNNAEYTYTLRDLTGVSSLDPAKEFPADGAAGEGFSNAAAALSMSPAMVQKYLDAGKAVAKHAVLLPDGIRFEAKPSSSDMTNQLLDAIRAFYARYTDNQGGEQVNLQGIVFETNQGGRLPVEAYVAATLAIRDQLPKSGATLADETKVIETVARERKLNLKYLTTVWELFSKPNSSAADQGLLEPLRRRWRSTTIEQADAFSAEILSWQKSLWRFSSIGHIGKLNGPKAWQEPVDPIQTQQELKFPLPEKPGQDRVSFFIQVGDAGDGNEGDHVLLERPRLVAPGRPEILLGDVDSISSSMEIHLPAWRQQVDEALAALDVLFSDPSEDSQSPNIDWDRLAQDRGLDSKYLQAWGQFLGLSGGPSSQRIRLTQRGENLSGYEFIDGWVAEDALSVVANSSGDHVRIPGNMPGKSIGVHPSPSRGIGIAWKSPIRETVSVEGRLRHAHTECGNGVAWRLELQRGGLRQVLVSGFSNGPNDVAIGPISDVRIRTGNEIVLIIEPRDGNHSCDLTNIDLTVRAPSESWNLSQEIAPNILEGNPHSDGRGRKDVWEFFSEQVSAPKLSKSGLPDGSVMAKWLNATDPNVRLELATQLEQLVVAQGSGIEPNHPDAILLQQLNSAGGPFWGAVLNEYAELAAARATAQPTPARQQFDAPSVQQYAIPASLAVGMEFTATARLDPEKGRHGSVQVIVTSEPRIRASFDAFRKSFPIALCYPKIVPVDEVVTLTLFHREDEPLIRLMLSDAERIEIDRLWRELHFVSQDALKLVDAYDQLWQYATQDADPSAFEPLRDPIRMAAETFRIELASAEPRHLEAVIQFADKAFRGSFRASHAEGLRNLYSTLRQQELSHADAIQFLIARILIAPEFLYRTEVPGPGKEPVNVSAIELANRLSYFLWASSPDERLLSLARDGRLLEDSVLEAEVRRMLQDPRIERFAVEWGCMWLHIRDLDTLDEKSETHFPEFQTIRADLYREAILWITDLIQNNGSVTDFLEADHTFVNDRLAAYYGIPDIAGTNWRKIDGVKRFGRGGILGLGAALAKQSGASRTSPILRGTWISEVVLGEKLPKPPKNVPVLSETPPEGMTERQLIERHSSDPACAKCHVRVDPFGFALEGYDAIGRSRVREALGLAVQTSTTLPDGTQVAGM
nr:DUF1592 domain-containing protein [Pirellula sp.]